MEGCQSRCGPFQTPSVVTFALPWSERWFLFFQTRRLFRKTLSDGAIRRPLVDRGDENSAERTTLTIPPVF